MNTLRDWLEAIGLGQYADAFAANDIDTDLLPRLDDRLLKDIGVSSAGHRLRLRDAIENGSPRRQTPARDEASADPTRSDKPLPRSESRRAAVDHR
jgi:hypothetical protein